MSTRARTAMLALVVAVGCSNEPPSLPQVPARGGPIMAHPQLVVITYQDDGDRAALEEHARWIVTSTWLTTVGEEYGVGAGSVLGLVELAEDAPRETTLDDMRVMIARGLADGTLPRPADRDLTQVLYMVHYPEQATLIDGSHASCADYIGFHGSARVEGVEFLYAAIFDCGDNSIATGLEMRENAVSHELIEAATDPFPSTRPAFRLRAPNDSWTALGDEVADLCDLNPSAIMRVTEGSTTYVAQRVWSNRVAAELSGDPCIPAPEGPFFTTFVWPREVVRILPGRDYRYSLRGWSTGPTDDWNVATVTAGTATSTVTLDRHTVNAGGSLSMTVEIPPAAELGTHARVLLASGHSGADARVVPVLVLVDQACSVHSTCETCNEQAGCGFCLATGRCEEEGPDGSLDSACAGTDWAQWSGACEDVCARSTSCEGCADRGGCGWCANGTPRCLPARSDYAGPVDGSCGAADWSFVPSYCPAP